MLAVEASLRAEGERQIKEGDVVIVYERHDRMKAVIVARNGELQNRFGVFPHNEWIGKPFGCRVVGKKGGGFVFLLAPTPELWTLVLPHRTQILYVADISFVISFLELRPGSVMLESGTGSGSLTHSLARAVAPSGHVHTFDFHEQRALAAKQEFERNGIGHLVTVTMRDIQGQGFPEEFVGGQADAVFLDLPQPWLAIPSVASSLRCDGGICSFSPCIEQVQRTCEALTIPEFTDIRTFEVLVRTYEVRQEFLQTTLQCSTQFASDCLLKPPPQKRQRPQKGRSQQTEQADGEEPQKDETINGNNSLSETAGNGLKLQENIDGDRLAVTKKAERETRPVIAKPYPDTKGHTGYLTFARRST